MIHEKTFKDRLSILIGERGIKPFVRRTGVSETSINQYLQGECLPTLKILESIATANGVSVGWLIGEEPYPQCGENSNHQNAEKSMRQIEQWISKQKDGINYWEVIKAKLSQEFPDFKSWLKENNL